MFVIIPFVELDLCSWSCCKFQCCMVYIWTSCAACGAVWNWH